VYDLSNLEAEVDIERQGDSNIARGQGRKGILIILYKRKLAKEHSKRRKKGTYINAKILHQVAAGGLSSRQDNKAAAGGDSHSQLPEGRLYNNGRGGGRRRVYAAEH
jgi:hypothetical protein